MARRAARVPPVEEEYYDDEEEFDGYEDDEDLEYVICPVCNGQGGRCRYCDGHGDVHPDDVEAILEAAAGDRGKKVFIIIGLFLFSGVLVAVLAIVLSNNKAEETPAANAENSQGAEAAHPESKKHASLPPNYSKDVAAKIVDMRFEYKFAKNYAKVIEMGEALLPQAKDGVQRRNIEMMLRDAKKKLGQ